MTTARTPETEITADPDVPLVRITREFDAPPEKVSRAHADPELVARWLGPRNTEVRIDHHDCRTGGSYRYLHLSDGNEFGFHGCFHEVRPAELIVQTFTFEGVPDGVALERLVFEDLGGGRTRLTSTSLVDSFEGQRVHRQRHGERRSRGLRAPGRTARRLTSRRQRSMAGVGNRRLSTDAGKLRPVRDRSGAAWIAPRLAPFGGWVGSVVPQGFEAYARILHPVPDPNQEWTTWAAVCRFCGRTPHALMQWSAIAEVVEVTQRRVTTRTMRWYGGEPEQGSLEAANLAALLAVLEQHSATPTDCSFALWDGYGWIHGGSSVAIPGKSEPLPPAFDPAVLTGPRLRHPNRDYVLFFGPLRAAASMGHQVTADWFIPQSPNLFWAADRSWCVGSEIDFDSTLVAGSAALIDAVLAEPGLETWRVAAGDSLGYDGDTINV